jgi:hypothetical protein
VSIVLLANDMNNVLRTSSVHELVSYIPHLHIDPSLKARYGDEGNFLS